MLVIPAVDLRGGRCVRLYQGRLDHETVYSDDPVAVAQRWAEEGAGRLHVVDLDGAFGGRPAHLDVIADIVKAVNIPVQVGGGIRTLDTVAMLLDVGVSRVIFGTAAVENPELVEEACRRWPGQVSVGIDAREGRVAVRGWVEETPRLAIDMARSMAALGVDELIVTDITRDGAMQGPNVGFLRMMAAAGSAAVIAAGGVASVEDILTLAAHEDEGIRGVIVGRALYTGDIRLPDVFAALQANREASGRSGAPEDR